MGEAVPKEGSRGILWSGPHERSVFGGFGGDFGSCVGGALDRLADDGRGIEPAESGHGDDSIFHAVELVACINGVLGQCVEFTR